VCPRHYCLLKLGKVDGNMSCVEKEFKFGPHKYEEYNLSSSVSDTVTSSSWLMCD
jgi:hypothetical protein